MSNGIHRINDIIKQVPGLRYDCSAGIFETDRRALYDFAELIIEEQPKREWVGLTAEDIEGLRHRNANDFTLAAILYEAESILKEKNT